MARRRTYGLRGEEGWKIRIRPAEVARACRGVTVAVRPQGTGEGYTVNIVDLSGNVLSRDFAEDGETISRIVRSELRMLDKCGHDIPMAAKSRHRQKGR